MHPYALGDIGQARNQALRGADIQIAAVGWKYVPREVFARTLKMFKSAAESRVVPEDLAIFFRYAWRPVLPRIIRALQVTKPPITAVPIPSRFGTSELLAEWLRSELQKQYGLILPQATVLERKYDLQIKDIPDCKERETACRSLFGLRDHAPLVGTVLLVDDVITSGSSLGACSRLLRHAGAGPFVAALLSGSSSDRRD